MSSEIKSTTVQTNSLKDKTGTRQLASDSGSAWSWGSGLPSGSIVQVQSFQKTDIASMTNIAKDTDYVLQDSSSPATSASTTGIIQVNITPQIASSKIWLTVSWFGEFTLNSVVENMMWRIYRDTTILTADSAGSRVTGISNSSLSYHNDATSTAENAYFQFFDTHGISAGTQITYKLGFRQSNANSSAIYTNRCVDDTDTAARERGVS